MRVACHTPMPPSPSGIADYSAALLPRLAQRCELEIVTAETGGAGRADIHLYQIGNNPFHAPAYESALRQPGVVVLHEANLHHLIAHLTIRQNRWDDYVAECEFDSGAAARAFAERVRKLQVGPDYDGVPMLKRLLGGARGLIAHSDYVIGEARKAGYTGPAARIPHGAWVGADAPQTDRMRYRRKLGIEEGTQVIGVFGHLKPYKRIAESLRAFARLIRLDHRPRMILAGEPHPDLPLEPLIRNLGLGGFVRLVGRCELDDFNGYLAASDIILNLRYPTVGETSGTLLRAMSMGLPTVVSDAGAFHEFPDACCLKVPIDAHEEDLLFEYMQILASRQDLAAAMGARAKAWVERECSWERVAELYQSFLEAVHEQRSWEAPLQTMPPVLAEPVEPEYVKGWAQDDESRGYVATHTTRLNRTLEMIPSGTAGDRILEMGAYMQITPALKIRLGYGEVRGCYFGEAGHTDQKNVVSETGEQFTCTLDLFDAEKDRFPYPDAHFATVLCCELIEHLPNDPMHMMAEINRILRPGGYLLLTTPNIGSLRALSAILQGYHPGFFPAYLRPPEGGVQTDARHNREYTPREAAMLFDDAGFTVERLETGAFRQEPSPELHWVEDLLRRYRLPETMREEGIYILGRKTGPVKNRYPAWLYA